MTVISSVKNLEALSLTVVAEFDAGVGRVWQIWEDPRQLERWWGPPTWPATFEKHEFVPGGEASYYMTGPEGEKARGWWRFVTINAPHRLEFDDGFADDNGDPVADMGTIHGVVTLEPIGDRTRMTIMSTFEAEEQMEKVVAMGMEEGMREALGQVDAILAESVNACGATQADDGGNLPRSSAKPCSGLHSRRYYAVWHSRTVTRRTATSACTTRSMVTRGPASPRCC